MSWEGTIVNGSVVWDGDAPPEGTRVSTQPTDPPTPPKNGKPRTPSILERLKAAPSARELSPDLFIPDDRKRAQGVAPIAPVEPGPPEDVPAATGNPLSPLAEMLLSFAGKATGLPSDFARNHDHYIHGTRKK